MTFKWLLFFNFSHRMSFIKSFKFGWVVIAFASLTTAGSAEADSIKKLLVVGNSITFHPASSTLDWQGNWGMAASDQTTDYVHVVSAMLEKAQFGLRPEIQIQNISDFERNVENFNFNKLRTNEQFQADAVIVFLGDNVKLEVTGLSVFEKQYKNVFDVLNGESKRRLYCVSTWWSNKKIDAVISSVCNAREGRFVDIKSISAQPKMKAVGYANAGVAAHPSDAGMAAIAGKIFDAMKGDIK